MSGRFSRAGASVCGQAYHDGMGVQQCGAPQLLTRGESHMSLTTHQVTFNANTCASGALWTAGAILSVCDWLGVLADGAGMVGVVAVAAGHLLCMHGRFDRQASRELEMFHLGRESVRPLR